MIWSCKQAFQHRINPKSLCRPTFQRKILKPDGRNVENSLVSWRIITLKHDNTYTLWNMLLGKWNLILISTLFYFLIVKKRKVDDDDSEPSTSKRLPTKMKSSYTHHLTWFYIIIYRCVCLSAHLLFDSLYFLIAVVLEKDVTCRYCSTFKPVYLNDQCICPKCSQRRVCSKCKCRRQAHNYTSKDAEVMNELFWNIT